MDILNYQATLGYFDVDRIDTLLDGAIVGDDASEKLTTVLLLRNTHVESDSLLIIKVQYIGWALWLMHDGTPLNQSLTMFNCFPFRYDYFRNRCVFVDNITDMNSIFRDDIISIKMTLIRNMARPAVIYMPDNIYNTALSRDHSDLFFGLPFFTTHVFKHDPSSDQVTALVKKVNPSYMVQLNDRPLHDPDKVSMNYMTTIDPSVDYVLATTFPYTKTTYNVIVTAADALKPPYTGFFFVKKIQIPRPPVEFNLSIKESSFFTPLNFKKVIANTCVILRSLDIGVNVINADTRFCLESMIEGFFVNDAISGPIDVPADILPYYEETFAGHTKHFEAIHSYSAWIAALKIVMTRNCKTPRVAALLNGILKAVRNTHRAMFGTDAALVVTNAHLDYKLHAAIFVALFNSSHVHPGIFHLGFYLVRQVAYYLYINHSVLADLPFYIPCIGFPAMSFESHAVVLVDMSSSADVSELEYYHDPPLRNEDWYKIDSGLVNTPTSVEEAVTRATPTVMFGSISLPLNKLGDAMRNVYLAAFPPNFFRQTPDFSDSSYSSSSIASLTSHPTVGRIARVLLRLHSSFNVNWVRAELEQMALPTKMLGASEEDLGYPLTILATNFTKVEEGLGFPVLYRHRSRGKVAYADTLYSMAQSSLFSIERNLSLRSTSQPVFAMDQDSHSDLLRDVLLVTWFLHSPMLHRMPYDRSNTISQSEKSAVDSSRFQLKMYDAYDSYTTVAVPALATSASYAPKGFVDGTTNPRQNSLFAAASVCRRYAPKNALLRRVVDSKRGIRIKASNSTKDLDGIRSLNIMFPHMTMVANSINYKAAPYFLELSSAMIFTATCNSKAPMDAGICSSMLMEAELPVFVESSSNATVASVFMAWSAVQDMCAHMNNEPYLLRHSSATYRVAPAYVDKYGLSRSSNPYLAGLRRLDPSVTSADMFSRSLTSPQLVPLYQIMVGSRIQECLNNTTNRNITCSSKGVMDRYLRATPVLTIDNTNTATSNLYLRVEDHYGSDAPSSVVFRLGRSPASTFAFYEAFLLHRKKDIPMLSPLEVFRLVSMIGLDGNVSNSTLSDRNNLPSVASEVLSRDQLIAARLSFARKSWSPNEFYGSISGYVRRGMDRIANVEENIRNNDVFSFATSGVLLNPSVLSKNAGSVTNLKPIYDVMTKRQTHMRWNTLRVMDDVTARLVMCRMDPIRKQWALVPRVREIEAGTAVGFLSGEVNRIELMAESVTVYDPVSPQTRIISTPTGFALAAYRQAASIFSPDTLYPTGEFEWFQYTGVVRMPMVPYRASKGIDGDITVINAARSDPQLVDSKTLSEYAYRERVAITGFFISAARFSSVLRYVRYTHDERIANAVFVRISRDVIARTGDEPQLSYWELRTTKTVVAASELVVLVPKQSEWKAFLFSGVPSEVAPNLNFENLYSTTLKMTPNQLYPSMEYVHSSNYIDNVQATLAPMIPRLLSIAREQEIRAIQPEDLAVIDPPPTLDNGEIRNVDYVMKALTPLNARLLAYPDSRVVSAELVNVMTEDVEKLPSTPPDLPDDIFEGIDMNIFNNVWQSPSSPPHGSVDINPQASAFIPHESLYDPSVLPGTPPDYYFPGSPSSSSSTWFD